MKTLDLLFAAFLLSTAYVQDAHAYLDPGTGSLLLQGVLALIAGVAVTVRLYWSKLKDFLGRQKTDTGTQTDSHG